MTLNTNQSVSGQKTFSNIQTFTTTNVIPGGQAFNVTSLFGGYQTRLYSLNDTYSTDLYYPKFNGIDRLVSTASTDNLQNKTFISNLNIRTESGTAPTIQWSFGYSLPTKAISLWDSNFGQDYRYYGFGIASSQLTYTTDSTSSDHVFYAATAAASRNELFRVKGGNV